MAEKPADTAILGLTARIVAAHAANNQVDTAALPRVIRAVYDTLATIGDQPAAAPAEKAQRLKMLKRHLSTSYDMTPEQYRAKWGLDSSYPMTAPNYAERRSALAKQIGLGTNRTSGR